MIMQELISALELTPEQEEQVLKLYSIYGDRIAPVAHAYMREELPMADAFATLRTLACEGEEPRTSDLIFCLMSALYLYEDYQKAGISDEVFLTTIRDLKYKLNECINCRGIFGLWDANWNHGFFKMTRFGIGRLQFDLKTFPLSDTVQKGYTVRQNEFALFCHIPSSGPLDHESCIESYKQVYAFVKEKDRLRPDGVLPILCHSWFLYPDFAPLFEGTNIGRFASDYTMLRRDDTEHFGNAWRVFSCELSGNDTASLPRNTTLQRRFVDYIDKGGRFGVAIGLLLFDGEKVI